MRLITERDKIKEAITNFRKAWGDGSYPADKRGIAIGSELAALDSDNVAVEKVNELIGNESWTQLKCSDCGGDSTAVIELGQEPDYESATAWVCFDCIRKAADMTHNSKLNGAPRALEKLR